MVTVAWNELMSPLPSPRRGGGTCPWRYVAAATASPDDPLVSFRHEPDDRGTARRRPRRQSPSSWLNASYRLTHPHGTGGAYPNFPETRLKTEAYYLTNTDRLRRLHAIYDPSGLFVH
jgi:hypothetical protein